MKLGIIGLPQSGKTTIFNALTGTTTPPTTSAGRIEVHTAVVDVPDARVDALSALYKPKKTIYAKVTYADITGLDSGSAKSGISGKLLNQLSQMDGFLHVLRCFDDENTPHPAGSVDPQRDLETMESELLLNDMIAIERKLERLKEERKKGGTDKVLNQRQTAMFERLFDVLSREIPLREVELTADEEKNLSGFGLLTCKPMLILLNLAEGQDAPQVHPSHPQDQVTLQGKLEMEIAQLAPEDAALFMEEFGIEEPSLNRMIQHSYDLLKNQSFFTIGDDEVRAWTVRRGTTALLAAGEIHSDLQKGFIRAEVIPWDELITFGGLSEARSKGKLRLEGKEYIVQDGEIMHVRFNI
ncbi:redox-regulated ATPase YchF [Chloroflexota bacterium]